MEIYDKGPRAILSLLLSSTTHKFYISEIARRTGLARNTVRSILDRLEAGQIVVCEKERFSFDSPFRAPRIYYTLDPLSFHHAHHGQTRRRYSLSTQARHLFWNWVVTDRKSGQIPKIQKVTFQ